MKLLEKNCILICMVNLNKQFWQKRPTIAGCRFRENPTNAPQQNNSAMWCEPLIIYAIFLTSRQTDKNTGHKSQVLFSHRPSMNPGLPVVEHWHVLGSSSQSHGSVRPTNGCSTTQEDKPPTKAAPGEVAANLRATCGKLAAGPTEAPEKSYESYPFISY